ncbi:hypothetical protein P154DRAFT_595614 [Amniculicola lignicola CBS 123094]|uniref:Uncharacterized protein n=1 Tax=Amniculicola lignicola CBS 123094 TaxID=1392246 RepID=A0A6A5WSF2_9PLEO|nr:hypothetical protein P154DRAFT_595614 [Amniculicola lignicola CBS 123094]
MHNNAPSPPRMLSDGKRMRQVWKPKDGDGDSSTYVVERSINLLRGHPTWKLYMEEVPIPITRGSKEEPPRYVYLDDKACHAVHSTNIYTNEELRLYWPFDFNHQGHIKAGRKNRGRPAHTDDSEKEFATAPLRSKKAVYEFTGAPEMTEYEPLRPKRPTRVEAQVAEEFAFRAERLKEQRAMQTMAREERWRIQNDDTPFVENLSLGPYVLMTPDMGSDIYPSVQGQEMGEPDQETNENFPPQLAGFSSLTHTSPTPGPSRPKSTTPPRRLKPGLGTFRLKPSLTADIGKATLSPASAFTPKRTALNASPHGASSKRRKPAPPSSPTRQPNFGGDGACDKGCYNDAQHPAILPGLEDYASQDSMQSQTGRELVHTQIPHNGSLEETPQYAVQNHVIQHGVQEDAQEGAQEGVRNRSAQESNVLHGLPDYTTQDDVFQSVQDYTTYACEQVLYAQGNVQANLIPDIGEAFNSQDDVKMPFAPEESQEHAIPDGFSDGLTLGYMNDASVGNAQDTKPSNKHEQEDWFSQGIKDEDLIQSAMEINGTPGKEEGFSKESMLQEENARLITELQIYKQDNANFFTQHKSQEYETRLESTKQEYEAQLDSARYEFQTRLESAERENRGLRAHVTTLETQLQVYGEENEQLARHCANLQTQFQGSEQGREQLAQQNIAVIAQLEAFHQENKGLKQRIVVTETELQTSDEKYEQAQKANRLLQKEKQQFIKRKEALEAGYKKLAQTNTQLTEANATIIETNAELTEVCATPKANFQASEQRNEKLQRDHEGMVSTISPGSQSSLSPAPAPYSFLLNDALQTIHTSFIDKTLNHYNSVIVMLLANRSTHEKEFRDRIAAFQDFANQVPALVATFEKLGLLAKTQIQPTMKLCDGLDTVLDAPGKYMYDNGLDEEWREMQDEAARRVADGGLQAVPLKRKWTFS